MGKLIVYVHAMSKITLIHFLYNFVLEYSNNVFLFVTGQDAVTVQLYLSP